MAKVNFKRVPMDDEVKNIEVEDGNFIVTSEGTAYIDFEEKRIKLGVGTKEYLYFTEETTLNDLVIKSNLLGNNSKINASEIAVVNNDEVKTLDNLDYDIIEKTNGFVIKFASGFMIQQKTLSFTKTHVADGSVFMAENDMGDWEIPFTRLLNFNYNVNKVSGSRTVWVASNSYNTEPTTATETSCGIARTCMTWNGESTYKLSCIGYGFWK